MNNFGNLLNLIKYPLITEKAINMQQKNQYVFIIDKNLKKLELKYIFKELFNIKIIAINTSIIPDKIRRINNFSGKRPKYKKAYITIAKEDSDFFKKCIL